MRQDLSIKSETSESYTIGGYAVMFGGEDLEGEHFAEDTDFWLGKVTEQPMLLYAHGQDEDGPGKEIVGRVTSIVKDKIGLWIEAQIDKATEYAKAIQKLVNEGVLGLSSGAVRHLIDVAADGKILTWPIVEVSLTPRPTEPRTLGVSEIRMLATLEPAIKSLLPANDSAKVELITSQGKRKIRLRF